MYPLSIHGAECVPGTVPGPGQKAFTDGQRLCEADCKGQCREVVRPRAQLCLTPNVPSSAQNWGARVSERDGGSGLIGGVMQMRLNGLSVCGLRGQKKWQTGIGPVGFLKGVSF